MPEQQAGGAPRAARQYGVQVFSAATSVLAKVATHVTGSDDATAGDAKLRAHIEALKEQLIETTRENDSLSSDYNKLRRQLDDKMDEVGEMLRCLLVSMWAAASVAACLLVCSLPPTQPIMRPAGCGLHAIDILIRTMLPWQRMHLCVGMVCGHTLPCLASSAYCNACGLALSCSWR